MFWIWYYEISLIKKNYFGKCKKTKTANVSSSFCLSAERPCSASGASPVKAKSRTSAFVFLIVVFLVNLRLFLWFSSFLLFRCFSCFRLFVFFVFSSFLSFRVYLSRLSSSPSRKWWVFIAGSGSSGKTASMRSFSKTP